MTSIVRYAIQAQHIAVIHEVIKIFNHICKFTVINYYSHFLILRK